MEFSFNVCNICSDLVYWLEPRLRSVECYLIPFCTGEKFLAILSVSLFWGKLKFSVYDNIIARTNYAHFYFHGI